jgi:hypothetical protein
MADRNITRTPYAQNSEQAQLEHIINHTLERAINTCDWVQVVAVDTVLKTVDVKPMVTQLAADDKPIEHSIIHGLPYFRYQAGGAAIIIDPVIGDKGLCVYAQNDVSGVQATGKEAPPTSYRKFDYADGCFIGCISAISPTPTTYIKMVDGEIDIVATTIKLNGAVVMTGTVTSNGKDTSDTHKHNLVQPGSGNSGAVI